MPGARGQRRECQSLSLHSVSRGEYILPAEEPISSRDYEGIFFFYSACSIDAPEVSSGWSASTCRLLELFANPAGIGVFLTIDHSKWPDLFRI